jgi:DtxR family transcriptional regulator, Mn-dependent transcriptional regulator
MRTESIDDYLKTIYQLEEQGREAPVSTTSIADHLGVANGSVTGMLKRLASARPKLVNYARYSGVTLTPEGRKVALEVIRHHRLLESYLNRMLGYGWDQVHDEAERLEHVISEEMEERMAAALGNPQVDPHGDPIPDRDGNMTHPDYQPLPDLPLGQLAAITRVLEQDAEFLRYLSEQGLNLSTQVLVLEKAPFHGPLHLRLPGAPQTELFLGQEAAEKILVLPLSL